jgi:hypothetical protein
MPRIPGIQYTAEAPGPSNVSAVPNTGLGQGLQELGRGLTQIGDVLKDQYDQSQANEASQGAQKQLNDFSLQLQSGSQDPETGEPIAPPPPEEHEELYNKEVERLNGFYGDKLSGRALRIFSTNFTEFSNRQNLVVKKGAIDTLQESARSKNDAALQQNASLFVDAGELMKPELKRQAMENIDRLEAQRVYTPAQALAARKNWVHDTSVGSMMKIMKQAPLDVVQAIDRGEFDELPVDERVKYRNAALEQDRSNILRANAEADRLDRLEHKKQLQVQDETFKDYTDRNAQGTLTPEWVQSNRDNFSKEDYAKAMKRASGEEEHPSNRQVHADLVFRAGNGEDVAAEAKSQYIAGNLDVSDFKGIVNDYQANSASAKLNNWTKSGATFISTAIVPPNDLNNPAAKVVAAEAIQDWYNWAAAHPKATPQQAQEESRRIVNERMLIKISSLALSQRFPRYMEGDRSNVSEESLKAAYQATKEAEEKGEIDKKDAGYQYELIRTWKNSMPKSTKVEGTK